MWAKTDANADGHDLRQLRQRVRKALDEANEFQRYAEDTTRSAGNRAACKAKETELRVVVIPHLRELISSALVEKLTKPGAAR